MVLRRVYKVGEVAGYLRNLLEADTLLNDLWVRGEISNFKHHTSGHLYFTLKDEAGCLRAVMFRSRAVLLDFPPGDGMRVLARGYVSLYERDGSCQLYVEELAPDGIGALYQAFCLLRDRLQAEGLFDPDRKRPLPLLPRKVGVVTSPNGAAWHDIRRVSARRFPGLPLVLAPAAVQGREAPGEIVAALAALDRRTDIDVIIVGRGGGSLEELWAFNTEEVARAIYRSRHPVVSAVGHETDYSIADMVADLRAPTPSAAAEMVVPSRQDLQNRVQQLWLRLVQGVSRVLQEQQARVRGAAGRTLFQTTLENVVRQQQELDYLNLRLYRSVRAVASAMEGRIGLLAGKLQTLSPLAILMRGYSICRQPETGRVIKSHLEVQSGQEVEVILSGGVLNCRVSEVKEAPEWMK